MNTKQLVPLEDRGPLRVMFVLSSMPVGGAETLLVNLTRRLDKTRFTPLLCCLQTLGPLGEELAGELPAFSGLIHGKYDLLVLPRLVRLFKRERVDAVVTIGAGDKMFWGRIAAHLAGVPVICSAIHSTGWPDVIERLNRTSLLTRWTDAFIAVADEHGRHLVDIEGFPAQLVHVIPNGIDVDRFAATNSSSAMRQSLGVAADAPLVGIVAALRPEKDHVLFLNTAAIIRDKVPAARFLIIGDGPERPRLEKLAAELSLRDAVQFLGNRSDVPELLNSLDVFVLTSQMEASPVSIMEAMACGKPVVAPRVGSIDESVIDGVTGFLVEPGCSVQASDRILRLLHDPPLAQRLGRAGRERVCRRSSLAAMVAGYEDLLASIYESKIRRSASRKLPTQETAQVTVSASGVP
jgi:glycosyltransferase involved in cell wall biosynthesis